MQGGIRPFDGIVLESAGGGVVVRAVSVPTTSIISGYVLAVVSDGTTARVVGGSAPVRGVSGVG